jgi:hypothetical protein
MDEQMPVVLYSIRRFSSFTLSSTSSEPHRGHKHGAPTPV